MKVLMKMLAKTLLSPPILMLFAYSQFLPVPYAAGERVAVRGSLFGKEYKEKSPLGRKGPVQLGTVSQDTPETSKPDHVLWG